MSIYLAGAALCSILATIFSAKISLGGMYEKPKHKVKLEDKIVFNTATTVGVAVSIITTSAAIITAANVTSTIDRSSVVVIVATCIVLFINIAVKKTIDKKQMRYENTTRKYSQ